MEVQSEERQSNGIVVDELAGALAGKRAQLGMKRLADFLLALLGLLGTAPLLLVVALAVACTSPGPVFFRQKRVGHHGRLFSMIKFRSMRQTGEVAVAMAARQREAAGQGILIKQERDPRVTPVGAFLRASSLDELPQLFNVLMGDMSLVGPRPLVPFMLQPYPDFSAARSLVRPGITGLWQIRDRENNTSAMAMMPHDLEYVREFSLGLDLQILFRTGGVVLSRKGAC